MHVCVVSLIPTKGVHTKAAVCVRFFRYFFFKVAFMSNMELARILWLLLMRSEAETATGRKTCVYT